MQYKCNTNLIQIKYKCNTSLIQLRKGDKFYLFTVDVDFDFNSVGGSDAQLIQFCDQLVRHSKKNGKKTLTYIWK